MAISEREKEWKKPRIWSVGGRYGYSAIDEYDLDGNMTKTVIAGLTKKEAQMIVSAFNERMRYMATEEQKKKLSKLREVV